MYLFLFVFLEASPSPHTRLISLSQSWRETKQQKKGMVIFPAPPSPFLYFLLSSLTLSQWIKHQDGGLHCCHCLWWDSGPTCMHRGISCKKKLLFLNRMQERSVGRGRGDEVRKWQRKQECERSLSPGRPSVMSRSLCLSLRYVPSATPPPPHPPFSLSTPPDVSSVVLVTLSVSQISLSFLSLFASQRP